MQYNRDRKSGGCARSGAPCGKEGRIENGKDEVQTEYLRRGGHRVGRCGPRRGGTDRWGDADRDAAEQIAGAVRARMERVLSTAYAASVEKAAVITAMNLCEELARRDAALRESEEKVRQLEAELHEIGGAEGLRQRLQQAEGKLKIAEAQLRQARAQPAAPAEKPAGMPVEMRNPLRQDVGEQAGLVSFFAKE